MVTPSREEITDRATQLFFEENPDAPTPEVDELKESGFYAQAQSELMRSESPEALSYLEEEAQELGRRVVTEKEHDDLIDLALRLERVKEREKQLKTGEKDLEARQNIQASMESLEQKIDKRESDHEKVDEKVKAHRGAGPKKARAKRPTCAMLMRRCTKSASAETCRGILKFSCGRGKKKKETALPKLPELPRL